MSYQVLYRRFRPSQFSDVAGQEHITSILKNQIISGKISHAYLFSGSKGTGKTSTAKIFARAVNCMDPQNGEPCGKCEYCEKIKDDNLTDIIEIDAASNRGIDEIRDLKDKVNYMPSSGKYRVYIIDEVHMLTQEAFNALLKTLEEPPEHIIFIFATTEPHKIIPTILSRCQRFDFARLSQDTIVETVRSILVKIDFSADEDALYLIAANSDGALRDALSFTDKAINTAVNNHITLKDVQDALGLAGGADLLTLAQAVADENVLEAFSSLDDILKKGSDINYIITQLIDYFRALMIYVHTANPERILGRNEVLMNSLSKYANDIPPEILISYVTTLSKLKNEARYLPNPRYLLEAALLQLCDKSRILDTISLTARVEKLEKQIEGIKNTQNIRLEKPKHETTTEVSRIQEPVKISPNVKSTANESKSSENLPQTDKETLAKIQKEVLFAGKFIHNRDRDILMGELYSCMKVAAYHEDTVYIYPTGTAVHMMDVFVSKNGTEKLQEILTNQLGRETFVELTEGKKSKEKKKDIMQQATEIFGELKEIDE